MQRGRIDLSDNRGRAAALDRLVGAAAVGLQRAAFRLAGDTVWTAAPVEGWGGVAVRYRFD